MSDSVSAVFKPGDLVHPKRKTGHFSNCMVVVDPQEIGATPIIGRTLVVLAFPNLHIPTEFNHMPESMQADIVNRLNAIREVPTDSLVSPEDKGLVLISPEWFAEHSQSPFETTTDGVNELPPQVVDVERTDITEDDVFRGTPEVIETSLETAPDHSEDDRTTPRSAQILGFSE
ncbi:MAG: hypothetical protein FGM24_04515 [Candidatus Kapabacteria bacterium]|nr:hypothetical protein [Candidatus Kapabacteria bacterium]